MISCLLKYQFLQNALAASLLASMVCGIVGVIIVEKNLVMMSGGIAHTSYGGVGLGYLLGFEPIIGAFLLSVGASVGICYVKRKGGTRSDVIIGLFWSSGMALGILLIGLMPGYPPDLSSYLFGSILSVTRTDLLFIFILTFVIVFVIVAFFDYWKAYLFDAEFTEINGVKTVYFEYVLFILIAMSVVAFIRVVGIILVLALFTAPTAISSLYTKNLKYRMLLSILVGCFCCLSGLCLSYVFNIPSGAVIVIVSFISYVFSYSIFLVFQKKLGRR